MPGPMHMAAERNAKRSGKITDNVLWNWMINYLKNYKKIFIIMLVFLVSFTLIDAFLPNIQKKIIDDGILKGSNEVTTNFSLIYLSMLLVSAFGSLIINYFLGKYGAKIIQKIRLDLFKNIQNMSMEYFETHNNGDIISIATNDIDQLNIVFGGQMALMLVNAFKAIIIIILMINLNWELTIISVLIIPLLLVIILFLGNLLRNAFRETRKKISKVTQVIEQNISGMKVIKSYGREKESKAEFDKANWDNREAMFKTGKIMGFLFPIFTFIIYTFMSLILLYSGYGLINKGVTLLGSTITIGELSAFNSYLAQLIFPIIGLLFFKQISDSALASAERIYGILHEQNSIKETMIPKNIKGINPIIEFENVSFNYKSRAEENKKDAATLINQLSPMQKIIMSKIIAPFSDEKKLLILEKFMELDNDERMSLLSKLKSKSDKKIIMEEFTKEFNLDLTPVELAKLLKKRLNGEYVPLKFDNSFDLNRLGELMQNKQLKNTQILELLTSMKIPESDYLEFSDDVKKAINKYKDNVKKKKDDVLKNITIKIPNGKTVAFVGETGAGKSTIIKLLTRFYDVKSGEIKIDGINITEFKTKDLRSIIGMVPQDNFLFSGTILQNLYYGLDIAPKVTQKMLKITKSIGLDDFIKELPLKYDTLLREMGTNLSIGQRQLICFARVLMIDPKILILDEATSSIDPYTEKIIQKAIKKMSKGRTTLIIAHRLSTIRDADIICVMGNGKIIEQGSHEELMKNKGHYFDLVNVNN
ncbi:MAG: ABC transporter ATP-binding protein [Candidatus Nanoarchaeia archaeon]|jgi:ABC-type multidrug transport system fused ATPase/permease subunit